MGFMVLVLAIVCLIWGIHPATFGVPEVPIVVRVICGLVGVGIIGGIIGEVFS